MGLDKQGIKLSEVNKRYPRTFQTLGYDVLMDVDSTYKPKVIPTFELCINTILTLLFMKPGQYPSIPELGIDIDSYLHEYADDSSIPTKIKTSLIDQCNRIEMTGIQIECFIDKLDDGTNALIVDLNADANLSYGSESGHVIIGISYDKLNRLYSKRTYIR